MKQTLLSEYIRDENNNPRGVCIAMREGNEILYGFSLCNTKADRYDKKKGIEIAKRRALAPQYRLPKVEDRLSEVLEKYDALEQRALKYFKDIPPENITLEEHILDEL